MIIGYITSSDANFEKLKDELLVYEHSVIHFVPEEVIPEDVELLVIDEVLGINEDLSAMKYLTNHKYRIPIIILYECKEISKSTQIELSALKIWGICLKDNFSVTFGQMLTLINYLPSSDGVANQVEQAYKQKHLHIDIKDKQNKFDKSNQDEILNKYFTYPSDCISSGHITLNTVEKTIKNEENDKITIIRDRECDILKLFFLNPNVFISYDTIAASIYRNDTSLITDFKAPHLLAVYFSQIRKHIRDLEIDNVEIINMQGTGYIYNVR